MSLKKKYSEHVHVRPDAAADLYTYSILVYNEIVLILAIGILTGPKPVYQHMMLFRLSIG